MNRRQTLFLILGLFALMWGLGLTAYFGGGMGASRVATVSTPQRFTAKEGTTRKNAVALVSSAREEGVDSFERNQRKAPEAAAADGGPIAARSLSKEQTEFRRDMAEAVLERVAQEETPEARAAALEQALGAPQDRHVEALLRLELGMLYEANPDLPPEQALAEYRRALELADAIQDRIDAIQRFAALAFKLERDEDVRVMLSQMLEQPGPKETVPAGPAYLRGMVELGDMGRSKGNTEVAEMAYREALEAGFRQTAQETQTRDALRLAGIRLVSLLRDQGRHQEAEDLGKRVHSRLRAATTEE